MKKIYITATVSVIVAANDDTDIEDIMDNYTSAIDMDGAEIVGCNVEDYNIDDVK